jgi:hypothetical protein
MYSSDSFQANRNIFVQIRRRRKLDSLNNTSYNDDFSKETRQVMLSEKGSTMGLGIGNGPAKCFEIAVSSNK